MTSACSISSAIGNAYSGSLIPRLPPAQERKVIYFLLLCTHAGGRLGIRLLYRGPSELRYVHLLLCLQKLAPIAMYIGNIICFRRGALSKVACAECMITCII